MSDLNELKSLLARLEWLEIALTGAQGQKGILEQLNDLMAEKTPDGGPGFIPQLESVIQSAQETLVAVASIHDALNEPIDLRLQRSIESTVHTAVEAGLAPLDERAKTVQRVADRASEQIAKGVAGVELISRTAEDTVNNTRRELEHVAAQVAVQLEDMLREVSGTLSAGALKAPLQEAAREAIQSASAQLAGEELIALHKAELRRVVEAIKDDFRQYQQGFQDELVEVQREASERVRKIIAGRAPSQAIIELYDRMDLLEAENISLRKHARPETLEVEEAGKADSVPTPRYLNLLGWAGWAVAGGASFMYFMDWI